MIEVVPLTDEMLRDAAAVHLEAFRGYANARLGAPYARRFLQWFVHEPSAIALAALDENKTLLGYVVGAPIGYTSSMNRELFPIVARQSLLRPWIFFDARFLRAAYAKVRALFTGPPTPAHLDLPLPAMSLVAIGTSAARRRSGAGARLTAEFEARARALGARSMRLSVFANNAPARALYARSGWSCPDEHAGIVIYYQKVFGAS